MIFSAHLAKFIWLMGTFCRYWFSRIEQQDIVRASALPFEKYVFLNSCSYFLFLVVANSNRVVLIGLQCQKGYLNYLVVTQI